MMPSSHPILCPNGCYHLLNAPSLPLRTLAATSGFLSTLTTALILDDFTIYAEESSNSLTSHLLDLPPKCPCLLLQATCSQGHVMELCHSQLVQSLATTFCSSSLLMPHSHNTVYLMSQNHLPPFNSFILLCSPMLSNFSFPSQSGSHA